MEPLIEQIILVAIGGLIASASIFATGFWGWRTEKGRWEFELKRDDRAHKREVYLNAVDAIAGFVFKWNRRILENPQDAAIGEGLSTLLGVIARAQMFAGSEVRAILIESTSTLVEVQAHQKQAALLAKQGKVDREWQKTELWQEIATAVDGLPALRGKLSLAMQKELGLDEPRGERGSGQ